MFREVAHPSHQMGPISHVRPVYWLKRLIPEPPGIQLWNIWKPSAILQEQDFGHPEVGKNASSTPKVLCENADVDTNIPGAN